MKELLTKQEILYKFPPKLEAHPYRRDRVLVGFAEKGFMVSRDEQGNVVYAINASHYEPPAKLDPVKI